MPLGAYVVVSVTLSSDDLLVYVFPVSSLRTETASTDLMQ